MNTKLSALILFMLAGVNFVSAQQSTPPPAPEQKISFLSVTFGSAIPLSDYAQKDLYNKYAGFAQPGFNFSLSLNALFKETNAGIAIMYNLISNPVDNSTLKAEYEKQSPGTTWNVETTNWKYSSFLAGICVGYPSGDFSFNLRLLIGITNARSPGIEAQATQNTSLATVKIHQDSDSESSLGLDGGVSLCYHLTKDISLIAGADYFSANPEVRLLAFGGGVAVAGEASQPVRIINATGGVALMF